MVDRPRRAAANRVSYAIFDDRDSKSSNSASGEDISPALSRRKTATPKSSSRQTKKRRNEDNDVNFSCESSASEEEEDTYQTSSDGSKRHLSNASTSHRAKKQSAAPSWGSKMPKNRSLSNAQHDSDKIARRTPLAKGSKPRNAPPNATKIVDGKTTTRKRATPIVGWENNSSAYLPRGAFQFSSFGPLYEPSVPLSSQSALSSPHPVDEETRISILRAWDMKPFLPSNDLLRDSSWYPQCKPDHLLFPFANRQVAKTIGTARGKGQKAESSKDASAGPVYGHGREALRIHIGADADSQSVIELKPLENRRLDSIISGKPGHLFNAGASVVGMDWCPKIKNQSLSTASYLAVSTMSTTPGLSFAPYACSSVLQIWSLDTTCPSDFERTTGELTGKGMECKLGVRISIGEALNIRWYPLNLMENDENEGEVGSKSSTKSLGLLSGVFTDGSISVFEIPHPEDARKTIKEIGDRYIEIEAVPVATFIVENTSCLSFTWGSCQSLAAGCMNGYVAIWDTLMAIQKQSHGVLPIMYFPVHSAAIRSIDFIQTPPYSTRLDGTMDINAEPSSLLTTGHDGDTYLTDLGDLGGRILLNHDRAVGLTLAFQSITGTVLVTDGGTCLRAILLKPQDVGSSRRIAAHQGQIQQIAVSQHHPFAATVSADGSCMITNTVRPLIGKKSRIFFMQKLFMLDFNEKNGEYRMIDNFVPERANIDESTLKKKNVKLTDVSSTLVWPRQKAVTCARWHPSSEYGCLLASGTASGLVRIDCTNGPSGGPKMTDILGD